MKRRSVGTMELAPIKTICVVGAGYMGASFGLQCAVQGYPVKLYDIAEDALKRAEQGYGQELEIMIEQQHITAQEKDPILNRIQFTPDLTEGVAQTDLVFEAVPEKLELKRKVFAQLDQICALQTILATGSSALRVSQIEDATQRLDRVLNAHFYPPVWQSPVVELMRGSKTSDETIARVRQFMQNISITPLMVLKESTGYLFNRVWRAIKKEVLHLVDAGVASFEDVDRAWMLVMKTPAGPFGIMDRVGLDVILNVELVYYQESGDKSDAPPKLLTDRVERGDLGVKTGKGFYTYPNPDFQNPAWLKGEKK
jgi:3-hydroxybutyryl-CoA dehydrogenase